MYRHVIEHPEWIPRRGRPGSMLRRVRIRGGFTASRKKGQERSRFKETKSLFLALILTEKMAGSAITHSNIFVRKTLLMELNQNHARSCCSDPLESSCTRGLSQSWFMSSDDLAKAFNPPTQFVVGLRFAI